MNTLTLEPPAAATATATAALRAPRSTKAAVMPVFSTYIYRCENGPVHLNPRLEQLAHFLMQEPHNAVQRTNQGGWHYSSDFLALHYGLVAEFRHIMEQHVQGYLNYFRPEARKRKDHFQLRGWINVNRAGDFNVLHCHPGSFVSAVYYVSVPADMTGGEIYFRDPRGPAVAMYETPEIELPWIGSGVGIPFTPEAGHLLMFPSWLEHHVQPFEGEGERISIAFNASNP